MHCTIRGRSRRNGRRKEEREEEEGEEEEEEEEEVVTGVFGHSSHAFVLPSPPIFP